LIDNFSIDIKELMMKLYRIQKSDIDKKGRGLYAAKDINEGTRIIDYVGKIITKKQTEETERFDNVKPIYLFNLNKKYDMDGDVSWNPARLINHSCSNNCDYNGTGLKLWVVAIKDIKKGEEITADYGFGYDEDYKQFACKCHSKNCCGYIVRAESRWRINKKFSIGRQKSNK
jgi:SET domain-containing protein